MLNETLEADRAYRKDMADAYDRGYEPSNCTWIPMSEQYKNKQSNCNKMPLPEPYKGVTS